MQKPELHHHEEPEKAYRPAGNKQVLQGVPQAHASQRSEVNLILRAWK
jgi:hypothetical protein